MATVSTNLVAQRFPTALSKKGLQRLAAISATASPNSLLYSVQTLSCGRRRSWEGRKNSSLKSIWGPAKLSRSTGDIGAFCCVEGRATLARVISARKNFPGACASRRRNWSPERLHSRRMENSSVPFGASGTNSAPEGFPNAAKLNCEAGSKEISGQPTTSAESTIESKNGTGGSVVADNGSATENLVPDPKLVEIRKLFQENSIDAYIVPSEDAHQSEFMAEPYLRRAYISGFTGSAGSVVITMDKAALWTDGRYFLQAESQLGPDWTLMRAGTIGVPTMSEWIRDNMPEGSRVGIDPYLFSSDTSEELKRTLGAKGHKLVLIYAANLVDKVWGNDLPGPPKASLRIHDIKFAGIDVPTKLANLRKELKTAGATAIVITMLDEVAWLLNLRGNDVPHSPVTYAYVIVELDSATLYVDQSKVTKEVEEHLANASVDVKSYGDLVSYVKRLAKDDAKLWLDPSKVSVAIIDAFNESCTQYYLDKKDGESHVTDGEIVDKADALIADENSEHSGPAPIYRLSPVSLAKALKNAAELEGMKQAHLRDAAALAEFFSWIEKKIAVEKQNFTEVEVAERIDQFRAKQPGFLDTSFETICGSGPNGAIVHYRAESGTCGEVNAEKLLLLDSGGQYVDGTTDITRTVHFGVPTSRERECFTRVLQGHIAVDRAIFPESTPGFVLDVLARTSLWKIGLDYRHGTGHGVGAGLNVHEGPQGISSRFGNMTGLQAGMIVSNEPGYYEDRSFGIRVENLVYIREIETENRFGDVTFLGFDRLTFVPIQAKMLELALLTSEEFKWLNDYHTEVWEKVSPLVKGDALEWLHRNTRPISSNPKAKSSEDLVTSSL